MAHMSDQYQNTRDRDTYQPLSLNWMLSDKNKVNFKVTYKDLIIMALGKHQASGLICYSWRLPPPRRLGARDSIEHFKKIAKLP
jgi:hypothetical protein